MDEILYVRFYDILENTFLLDLDWHDGKEYSKPDVVKIGNLWLKFQDRIFELDENGSLSALLRKREAKTALEARILLLVKERNNLAWFFSQYPMYAKAEREKEYFENLHGIYRQIQQHDKKIRLKVFEPEADNIKLLDRCIASLNNEYATKYKDIERKTEKAKTNVYLEIANVGKAIGMRLDASTLTVPEMFAYRNMAKDLVKQANIANNAQPNGGSRQRTGTPEPSGQD